MPVNPANDQALDTPGRVNYIADNVLWHDFVDMKNYQDVWSGLTEATIEHNRLIQRAVVPSSRDGNNASHIHGKVNELSGYPSSVILVAV